MTFNANKCKVLRITNKWNTISRGCYINNEKLAVKTDIKYFGITISSDLPWGKHRGNIIKQANSTMTFLKRNIWSASVTEKDVAFNTFLILTLQYASSSLAPYTKRDTHKTETIQYLAARFVMSNYMRTSSAISMMHQLAARYHHIQTSLPGFQSSFFPRIIVQLPSAGSNKPVNAGELPGMAGHSRFLYATQFLTVHTFYTIVYTSFIHDAWANSTALQEYS